MWLLMSLALPQKLIEAAGQIGDEKEGGGCHHDYGDHDSAAAPQSTWTRIASAYFMDWSMLWKEIVIGVLIAGFLMVLVPHDW